MYGEKEKTGKQIGGDILSNKKTFLMIKALQVADKKTKAELSKLLMKKNITEQEKIDSVRKIFHRLKMQSLIKKEIKMHFDLAFRSFSKISVMEGRKKILRDYVKRLMKRNF